MNDHDDTTFARFAERFARIERYVPAPSPYGATAVAGRRGIGRLSPITGLFGVAILLAAVLGLAVIGTLPPPTPTSSPSAPAVQTTIEPTASAWTPGEPTTVRGRILDASGNPARDVTVQAYPGPERGLVAGSAVTDAGGDWAITLPTGNTYCLDLALSLPGPNGSEATEFEAQFGPSGLGSQGETWPCLDKGGDIVVDITLPAMRLVSGTVVDGAGRPLTLTDVGGPFTRIQLTVASTSVGLRSGASADGRFSIWVPEGSWYVIAWVFRGEGAALSKSTPLEVGADPITGLMLPVDAGSLLTN